MDRRERVRSGVRSVTYCRTSSKKIVAQSVSLDGEGLQKLIEERPTLAGVKQLAWNVETGGLPVPSGQTPTDDGGFQRYQAKDAYYLFEAAPADLSARMGARCATPSAGASVLCRLYKPIPGKYALQIDLVIDQVPPARWADVALEGERFLDSQKP